MQILKAIRTDEELLSDRGRLWRPAAGKGKKENGQVVGERCDPLSQKIGPKHRPDVCRIFLRLPAAFMSFALATYGEHRGAGRRQNSGRSRSAPAARGV